MKPQLPTLTQHQLRIADAIAEYTDVFFINPRREYDLIIAVEKALPLGKVEVARAFYEAGDILGCEGNAAAVVLAMGEQDESDAASDSGFAGKW